MTSRKKKKKKKNSIRYIIAGAAALVLSFSISAASEVVPGENVLMRNIGISVSAEQFT